MLYLISGAASSGKTTVVRALAGRLPGLEWHHDYERPAADGTGRVAHLDAWIEDALGLERDGVDLILEAQSPLGELLSAPRAIELEGIAPCLLDCHDFVRMERMYGRSTSPDVGMDHFCWAVFHRLHARDPQWEQRVILRFGHDASAWARWTGWRSDDPRWCVHIHDSTDEEPETTIDAIAAWIEGVREKGTPLSREGEWWRPAG